MEQELKLSAGEEKKSLFSNPNIPLGLILALIFLLAVRPSLNIYITFAILPLIVWLMAFDEFYVVFAIFFFFYEQLIIKEGSSAFRIVLYLFYLKFFLSKRKININATLLPAIFVIIFYAAFAMMNADTSAEVRGLILKNQQVPSDFIINSKLVMRTMMDLTFVFIVAHIFSTDRKLLHKFFLIWVLVAIASGTYGFFAGNVFDYNLGYNATGAELSVTRYMGSVNDPNYIGIFMNVAIFAVVNLSMFKKLYIKLPLLLILYYFVIASGSITALVANAILWAVYIILRYKKSSIIILVVAAIVASLAFFAVTRAPVIKDLSVVVSLEQRISKQFLENVDTTDTAALTSGRTKNWDFYWNYYNKQDILKKLFGGNIVITSSLEPKFKELNGSMPHQAYIGFLMNFGLIGTLLIVLCLLAKNIFYVINYIRTNNEVMLLLIMVNVVWIFYGATIDYFSDWRLMFLYFI